MAFNTDTTTDSSVEEDSNDTKETQQAQTVEASDLPVDVIVDEVAAVIRESGDSWSQRKQMLAIGSATLLLAVYMVIQAYPAATLPPGTWGNMQPIVLALLGVGFGSEAFKAGKLANEKRR